MNERRLDGFFVFAFKGHWQKIETMWIWSKTWVCVCVCVRVQLLSCTSILDISIHVLHFLSVALLIIAHVQFTQVAATVALLRPKGGSELGWEIWLRLGSQWIQLHHRRRRVRLLIGAGGVLVKEECSSLVLATSAKASKNQVQNMSALQCSVTTF